MHLNLSVRVREVKEESKLDKHLKKVERKWSRAGHNITNWNSVTDKHHLQVWRWYDVFGTMVTTLKVHIWPAQNVHVRLVKGPHEPYQALWVLTWATGALTSLETICTVEGFLRSTKATNVGDLFNFLVLIILKITKRWSRQERTGLKTILFIWQNAVLVSDQSETEEVQH